MPRQLLYHVEVTRTEGNRSMCVGRLYKAADGTLVMTAAQEGLLRPKARL